MNGHYKQDRIKIRTSVMWDSIWAKTVKSLALFGRKIEVWIFHRIPGTEEIEAPIISGNGGSEGAKSGDLIINLHQKQLDPISSSFSPTAT